jgi:hypothetical protein
VHLTDTGTDLLVELGKFSGTDPDDGSTYADEDDIDLVESGAEPAATVSGTAADLDTWLWKRDPGLTAGHDDSDRIRVEGDRITYEKLSAILGQPIT